MPDEGAPRADGAAVKNSVSGGPAFGCASTEAEPAMPGCAAALSTSNTLTGSASVSARYVRS